MADVVLGGVLELEGSSAVTLKFAKVNRAAKDARGGMNAADKAAGRLGRGLKKLARIAKRVLRPLKKLFSVARSIVGIGGLGLGVGAIALGAKGIKDFGRFSLDIARIGTLLPPTTNAMERFGGAVRGAAIEFGTDTTKSAGAFFDALSAGIAPKDLEQFNTVIGQASVGGFTDMSTAIKGVTSIMDSYDLSVGQAREVSDAFFVANEKGKTTFEKLAGSVGRAAPLARAIGLDFKEFMSAVTTGTKTLETTEAVSGLKALFSNITKPTKEAMELVSKLYDTDKPEKFFSVNAVKSKGFINFLTEMKEKTGGDVTALNQLFGSSEALNVVLGLTSETGIKTFNESLDKMKNNAGQTGDAFKRVSDTVGFKMKQIGSGLSDLRLSVGAGLVEGFGLGEIRDIPAFFKEQSAGVAEGAKAFAVAFMETLDPAFKLGKIDFKGIGDSMGSMAATIAKGIGKLISGLGSLVEMLGGLRGSIEIINQFLGGKSPLERAQARVGKEKGAFGADFMQGPQRAKASLLASLSPLDRKRLGSATRKRDVAQGIFRITRNIPGMTAAGAAPLDPTAGGLGGGQAAFRSGLSSRQVVLLQRLDSVMKQANDKVKRQLDGVARQANVAHRVQLRTKAATDVTERAATTLAETVVAAEKKAAGLVDAIKNKFSLIFNLKQESTLNVNGKKKKKRSHGSSHRFERGKGDGTLPTTFENQFLLFDDDGSIVDVPDEFVIVPDAPDSAGARADGETLAPGRRSG